MASGRELLCLAVLAGCAGSAERRKGPAPEAVDTAVSCDPASEWEPFAEGYLTTWCTPCHAAGLVGAERAGAPTGVDFDTWTAAALWADGIAARTLDGTMPPGGGPSEADRARIVDWVACGALGSDPVSVGCDGAATWPGDLHVDASLDATRFCADAGHVEGTVFVSTDTVGPLEDCLCSIGGDLVVQPGAAEVSLLALENVGGDVAVSGPAVQRVALPNLARIDGGLEVVDTTALSEVQLSSLATVGDAVVFRANAALTLVSLPHLDQAAALEISGHATLQAVTLGRLAAVHGDLDVRENASLAGLVGTEVLRTVGGTLSLVDNDALAGIDKFTRLETVGGDLRVEAHDSLTTIDGFYALTTVSGTVSLHANPRLQDVHGFSVLESAGSVHVTESGLEVLTGFDALRAVEDGLVVRDNSRIFRLSTFGALETVGGDLDIRGNASMGSVTGLESLRTIGGQLWISGDRIARITGLSRLESVAGEVTLASLPRLREAPGFTELTHTGSLRLQQLGLTDLEALRRLREVDGDLVVRSNPELGSVRGLEDVSWIGGDLDIRLNPALPAEDAEHLGDVLGPDVVQGAVRISDNG